LIAKAAILTTEYKPSLANLQILLASKNISCDSLYTAMDIDRSDWVSLSEFSMGLQSVGISWEADDIQDLFDEIDGLQTSQISSSKFKAILADSHDGTVLPSIVATSPEWAEKATSNIAATQLAAAEVQANSPVESISVEVPPPNVSQEREARGTSAPDAATPSELPAEVRAPVHQAPVHQVSATDKKEAAKMRAKKMVEEKKKAKKLAQEQQQEQHPEEQAVLDTQKKLGLMQYAVTPDQRRHLQSVFTSLDQDSSGYIRLSEMGQFGTITAEQQESLFDAIGCICTEDETVTLEYFMAFWEAQVGSLSWHDVQELTEKMSSH